MTIRRFFIVALSLVAVPGLGAAPAAAKCTMASSQPDRGSLTLRYLRPSTKNSDRNDYRLSGTVRWNSKDALACFSKGRIDWAYEHNLVYQRHFDRKIWNVDFSAFPAAAHLYIDTTAGDHSGKTDLSFGIFRPDKLKAGRDYHFAYSLFLPRKPAGGTHSFYLAGEVLERNCSRAGPWCVGLRGPRDGIAFIGTQRAFSAKGTTCWNWRRGKTPTPCSGPAPPGGGGGEPTPSPTVSLAQGPPAPAGYRYAISISGFAPNADVSISCRDSADPGGFYTFALRTDASGNASTSDYCYSADGPDHWVVADGQFESNHVSW
jgi:hypothetical protein